MGLQCSLCASEPEPRALPGTGRTSCHSQTHLLGGICVLGWPSPPAVSTKLWGWPAFLAPRKLLLWDPVKACYEVSVP